ncbi:hypothetical protein B0A55_08533 [Friedmanniomyces simplex]|uniref:Uncharacterized protein n=1 Tax=Friedmanniomyces simplex TaxID=329884 RepID=A0A4V5NFM7_9PEZI|nr:hypothetical protein B0A55_08533 [Friedmanniomyces simplex]
MGSARTDLSAQKQEDVATWKRNHESWLLPYLDIDGLSRNPSRLLLLLHYRTNHTLQDWFAHDCHHLKCAFSEGLLVIAYNPHCVVVHGDRDGDLREWESVGAHRGDIVGFPRAMATFEAQGRLAVVLKTVLDLLHGNEAPLGNDYWLLLVSRNFAKPPGPEDDVLSDALGRPFCAPHKLDIGRITRKLRARLDAASHALFIMQTDPEHVRTLLTRARSCLWLRNQSPLTLREELLRIVIGPMVRLERLPGSLTDALHVSLAVEKFSEDIEHGRCAPPQYQQAFHLFQKSLESLLLDLVLGMHALVGIQPAFEHLYCECGLGVCPHAPVTAEPDLLSWGLCELSDELTPWHHDFLIGCISDVLARAEGKQRDRVDNHLYAHLQDIAMVSEALTSLELHRPCVAPDLKVCGCRINESLPECPAEFSSLDKFLKISSAPSESPKDTIKRYRAEQAALNDFWRDIYKFKDTELRNMGFHIAMRLRYLQAITVHSRGGFTEALERRILAFTATADPKVTELIPVSPTSLDLFHRMFTPTATHKKTASIPWDDLVIALVDAGCTIEQKSGGSAVNFILPDRAGVGRVSIHRPHPDSRVNPIFLKDCARKVEKYFGWRREGFVERVRTPAG